MEGRDSTCSEFANTSPLCFRTQDLLTQSLPLPLFRLGTRASRASRWWDQPYVWVYASDPWACACHCSRGRAGRWGGLVLSQIQPLAHNITERKTLGIWLLSSFGLLSDWAVPMLAASFSVQLNPWHCPLTDEEMKVLRARMTCWTSNCQ